MAATPPNVELDAAKFLHKLIQESKDEPTKLATKLHAILQYMRSIGKENSMPYQVISRAMETVINQHGLDIESLMSSRLPLASGTQEGDSSPSQVTGSSHRAAVEKDSKESFAADESAKGGTYLSRSSVGPSSSEHDVDQGSVSHLNGTSNNIHGGNLGASGSYASIEQGIPGQMQGSSSYDNQGVGPKMVNDRRVEAFLTPTPTKHSSSKGKTGNTVEQEGGHHNTTAVANKTIQGCMSNIVLETTMLRNDGSRDLGKLPVQAPTASSTPFRELHLKQLRAQCLVFLALRNGLMPKKLHLDLALGNSFPKEDGSSKDIVDQKGKEQTFDDPSIIPEVSNHFGRLVDAREGDRTGPGSSPTVLPSGANFVKEVEKPDTEMQSLQVNKMHVSSTLLEKDGADQEKEDTLESTLTPSPKYTTLEKWIIDQQKSKNVIDQSEAVKRHKTEQRVTASSEMLKEFLTVNTRDECEALQDGEVCQSDHSIDQQSDREDIDVLEQPETGLKSERIPKSSCSRNDLELLFGKKLTDAAEILGVSRSTFKRFCREHNISRWPSHKRGKRSSSSRGSVEPISQAARRDPSSSEPTTNVALMPATSTITVKAAYGEKLFMFKLLYSSTMADLVEKVINRTKLGDGTFDITYLDEDNDCISLACDEDLHDCMEGKTTIRMQIEPIANKPPFNVKEGVKMATN